MNTGMIIMKHTTEGFSFCLTAPDGLILCRSGSYADEEGCHAAIAAIRTCCAAPVEEEGHAVISFPKYVVTRRDGQALTFALLTAPAQALVHGPTFLAGYTCKAGIQAIARYAPQAELIIPTEGGKNVVGQTIHV